MHSAHAHAKRGNPSHCHCRRRLQTTAGSRPPLFVVRSSVAEPYSVLAVQRRYREPRRADARRSSSLSVRPSPNDARFSRYSVGVTNHGGLTPGALDRMCVCASQKAVFHGRTIVQQSRAGGVSPPWQTKRRCKAQPRIRDDTRGCNQERGRKPPVVRQTWLQVTCRTPCATLHRVHTTAG
jgi:hypothetical protein